MLVAARAAVLAILAIGTIGTIGTVGVGPAEAQLWKPAKKPAAAVPSTPARAKAARTPRVRRPAKPTRPAKRPVFRDEPAAAVAPARGRADREHGDDLPDFDDSPVIVVELPARGER